MRVQRIISMLKLVESSNSEEIKIAKGEYKYAYSVKAIYRMHKRKLKYRKDGKRQDDKVKHKE